MARSMWAGSTSYQHQPVSELLKDLKQMIKEAKRVKNELEKNFKTIIKSSYHKKVDHGFLGSVGHCISLAESVIELKDILSYIKKKRIDEIHVKRLKTLGEESDRLNREIGEFWHHGKEKDYENKNFHVVEGLYTTSRTFFASMLDLNSMADKLKDIVNNHTGSTKKKGFFGHWLVKTIIGAIIVAFISEFVGLLHIKDFIINIFSKEQKPQKITSTPAKSGVTIERKIKTGEQERKKKETRIQIERAIKDADEFLNTISKNASKERKLISGKFNRMNALRSSAHVESQKEVVRKIEIEIKNVLKNLDRKIEDSLLVVNRDKEDFKIIPWLKEEYEEYVRVKEKSEQAIKNIKSTTKSFLLRLGLERSGMNINKYINENLK